MSESKPISLSSRVSGGGTTSPVPTTPNFTPREIVSELDKYIVGQAKAKRSVAIALRNRWRRQQVAPELRDDIAPKNIILIGPTGVGKTEIARRLAKLAHAPFVKVEASKFTEVGYVGRDVESIVRDLVENALGVVRNEHLDTVRARAHDSAEERIIELLAQRGKPAPSAAPMNFGPFVLGPQGFNQTSEPVPPASSSVSQAERDSIRVRLRAGEMDDEVIEVDVADTSTPSFGFLGGQENMESSLREMFANIPGWGARAKRRSLTVKEAWPILENEEAAKLLDTDRVQQQAIERAEQTGIVFLDEIDKIAGPRATQGPDVSREGVQRDLLPIVEGSTVTTKYGPVRTDHVLFIAAGAFHVSKVSDLIPELQGRFPVRVELDSLTEKDFVRILTEPKNALTRQYEALINTEGVRLTFSEDAVLAIAKYAAEANRRLENIGARRLHTVMEALLDEIAYRAPEMPAGEPILVDAALVEKTLEPVFADQNLSKYIL